MTHAGFGPGFCLPAPLQGIQQYPDGDNERYDDAYDRPLPQFGDARWPPGSIRSEPLPPPAISPQDHGTAVAALPPEYQPERGLAKELSPQFYRRVVDYATIEPSGTIIVDTPNTYLYLRSATARRSVTASVSAAKASPGRAPSASAV